MKADKLLGLSNTLSDSSHDLNNSSVVFNLKQNNIMSSFDDTKPKTHKVVVEGDQGQ